ncbi:bifunctional class I SAM-dependent methyltransferase/NUDIX hydrolase [Streptomyces sp. WI04-05B]|uniref:Methyltransferase n=1 Tax=Streptomyces turgidiscabies (strain Car8) TaxID=698760 RepID=L7F269_STRT8|nr:MULTISPECIES: NUDIX domain-containing protein [Streptomyces]ELP65723.1 methyltransferase [Streptomyces turgidiscabies Car8]MDX2548803.1 NUDIX domain-containing protein [Streptomyces sp. WI04-05B]MDX2590380.1 NUDIX domain-containing protein [Streptomyces sp. WI04-05A]MDX3500204.1 NUDIX domain-containing protein [Streptomyces turgidiscabies]GAQ75950.1 bifunctional 3-demethylubiquinone-9 3-methyltransferase/ 2-octaprenyl-6-hydroxy phenol methylase [Streptomyces turgidiscabies]
MSTSDSVTPEQVNEDGWLEYGQRQLDRGYRPPEVTEIDWGFWGTGPGTSVLGNIAGHRLLDIGSGAGVHAAHLARAHAAFIDAIDISATQQQRARHRFTYLPGVRYLLGDAVAHLRDTEPYDLVYSVHGLVFIDPCRLLPVLRDGIRPGGRLVFSTLHTNLDGRGPSSAIASRQEEIRLAQTQPIPVQMWILAPDVWERLLAENGFAVESIELLHAPDADNPVVVQLIQARRLIHPDTPRVLTQERSQWSPLPQAALGVCVIVTNPDGHVLIGQHRLGTHELPGGKVDASASAVESIESAAMRALAEETRLVADPKDVRVLALLLDARHDINRLTAAVVIRGFDGTPTAKEPKTVTEWRWHPLDSLPSPLFVPSAQVLRCWRPDLPIDHPPAHRYPVDSSRPPRPRRHGDARRSPP